MKEILDLHQYYEQAITHIKEDELNHSFPSHFYESFYQGLYLTNQKQEISRKKFDYTWIKTIEAYYPSIDKITRNMKSQLKYESEILPIEKIKRVGPEAIKHLSSHTNLISEIDEEENVTPEKLLSDLSDIDYGIYENRFIMTLAYRLRDYVLERIRLIEKELYAKRTTQLKVVNEFWYNESKINLSFDLSSEETYRQKKEDEHNLMVLERAQRLYKLISNLLNSTFIKTLKHHKKVIPPIIKTQIILKNTDFKNAYLLWLYLDKTYTLDFSYEQESRQKRFDQLYQDHLSKVSLLLFSTLFYHNEKRLEGNYQKAKFKKTQAKRLEDIEPTFSLDPTPYVVENQEMNEYFLREVEKTFKKHVRETKTLEDKQKKYIKDALSDLIQITNRVAWKELEVNQDQDVFNRLVDLKDPKKALDKAYEKQKLSRILREVKERDYKEAVELEKKWFKEMVIKQKELIDDIESRANQKLKETIEKESKKYEQNIKKRITKDQKKYTDQITKERRALAELKKKLESNLQKEKKRVREEKKLKLEKERLKLKQKKQKELEKKKLQEQKKKENAIKRLEKEKALVLSKNEAALKKLKY